jgi:hypothetical protein
LLEGPKYGGPEVWKFNMQNWKLQFQKSGILTLQLKSTYEISV